MPTRLRFSTGRDILSWGVCRKTASKFAHVDFLMSDGQLLGAIPGKGVVLRSPTPEKELRSLVLEAPVENGYKYALEQLGKPYDWGAILGLSSPFPVQRNWLDDRLWYCSELAVASLMQAGLPLFPVFAWGITPRDLSLSPLLKN